MILSHRFIWIAGLLPVLLLVAGCDFPTEGPSFETNAELNAPLVAEKTFAFLGGAESKHDPLLDTTRAGFDSLFSVGASGRTVYVEQAVNEFGMGTLDDALDEATRGMRLDTSFAAPLVQQNRIATQGVAASFERTNGTFESPGRVHSHAMPDDPSDNEAELSFPMTALFDPPTTEVVDATDATVVSVVLTDEATNEITFTLENNRPKGTPLTNGTAGKAPEIALRNDDETDPMAFTAVGTGPIGPGEERSLTVDVSGKTLGRETSILLRLAGSDADDVLKTDTHPRLRYETVTLEDADDIRVKATAAGVETPASTAARFAGLDVREGGLRVQVENALSFPIAVDHLTIDNDEDALALLPDDFPPLDVALDDTRTLDVQPGASAARSFDLAGNGVARRVDATIEGSPAQTSGPVTLHADDGLQMTAQGETALSNMYFWPEGEQLGAEGRLSVDSEHVEFERADDFVELGSGHVQLHRLENELGVGFESFALSYPNVRRPDDDGDGRQYAPDDSLVIAFIDDPDGPYEFAPLTRESAPRSVEIPIDALRILPKNNTLAYHLHGTMETVPDTTEEYLRVLRADKTIRSHMTFDRLDIRALRGRIHPLTIDVTRDADGNGRLDVADDAEAREVSFQGLRDITRQFDGLQLQGGRLTLSTETDLGTDARLYGIFEGHHEDGSVVLAGRGPRRVSASDPVGDGFERAGAPIAADELLQFDVGTSPSTDPGPRSVTLTEENSTVEPFLSPLPTRLRMAGTVHLQGGRTQLRRPIPFDVGVGVRIPLSFAGSFSYRDTLDANLEGLEAVTDPDKRVTISSASLQLTYENALPLGLTLEMTVLDENGAPSLSIPSGDAPLSVEAAPKTDDGTAASTREGTVALDLEADEVRALARGQSIGLQVTMDQQPQGPAAQLRADDTVRLSLSTDIDASVRVGE